MSKHEEIYVIPSGISKRVAETICLELESLPLYTSEVANGDIKARNSKVCGIPRLSYMSISKRVLFAKISNRKSIERKTNSILTTGISSNTMTNVTRK